eukprot:1155474-Pelagomonas_calceolata.AAC.9
MIKSEQSPLMPPVSLLRCLSVAAGPKHCRRVDHNGKELVTSAAAFTKGLLDLEGNSLTPILVSLGACSHPTPSVLYWTKLVSHQAAPYPG